MRTETFAPDSTPRAALGEQASCLPKRQEQARGLLSQCLERLLTTKCILANLGRGLMKPACFLCFALVCWPYNMNGFEGLLQKKYYACTFRNGFLSIFARNKSLRVVSLEFSRPFLVRCTAVWPRLWLPFFQLVRSLMSVGLGLWTFSPSGHDL